MMASPQAGIAAISAGNAGAMQNQINYTRTFEKEADRIGLRILSEAGFNPFSAADFFGKLLESKRWSSQAPAFLQTHPLSLNRVAEARNRAENMPKVQHVSSEMFRLVKARIQARYFYTAKHNISDFTQRLKAHHNINKNAPDSHLVYGLAIALMRDNQFTQALSLLQQLHRNDNENLAYIDALADVYIALNKFENANDLLKPLAQKQPNNAIVTLNYANVLYKAGQHAQAIEVLKDYLMINPDSVLGHQLISDAYAASQQPMQMHQANAEFYHLLSIHQKAIDELQFAYNYAENYLTKQRIRARINQLREKQLQMSQM